MLVCPFSGKSADPCSARGHKAVGAKQVCLPLPLPLPAGRTEICPYLPLHALTCPYTRLPALTGCPHPRRAIEPSFLATSTKKRHLHAPNLERHATWACADALFCSTSTRIGHFKASTTLNLLDVIEESPPRCFTICSCAPRRFSREPFFRRRHRIFEHGPKMPPRGHKIQTS